MLSLLTNSVSVSERSFLARKRFGTLFASVKNQQALLFEDCSICGTCFFKYCKWTLTVGDQVKAHEHGQILIYLNGGNRYNQTDSSLQTYHLFFMTTYCTHNWFQEVQQVALYYL